MTEFSPERYAFGRNRAVTRCLRWRYLIANPDKVARDMPADTAKIGLRKDQMNLLRLRIWRATGSYPGEH